MEKGEEGDDEKWMYVVDAFHMLLSDGSSRLGSGSPSQIPIRGRQRQSWKTDHKSASKVSLSSSIKLLWMTLFFCMDCCVIGSDVDTVEVHQGMVKYKVQFP